MQRIISKLVLLGLLVGFVCVSLPKVAQAYGWGTVGVYVWSEQGMQVTLWLIDDSGSRQSRIVNNGVVYFSYVDRGKCKLQIFRGNKSYQLGFNNRRDDFESLGVWVGNTGASGWADGRYIPNLPPIY